MKSDSAERAVLGHARAMLAGEIDLVLGCREIVRWATELPRLRSLDEPLNVLRAVESETDDLPLGDVRKHWASDALSAKDREAQRYLERCKPELLTACSQLVEALEHLRAAAEGSEERNK